MAQRLNVNTSIVDWLKANGADSSFGNRAKLAQQYGIVGNSNQYTGSYNQNVNFLNYVKKNGLNAPKPAAPAPAPTPAPVVQAPPPPPPKPQLSEQQLRDYSLRALAGDKTAMDYLKNNNFTAMSGQDLWKGFDTNNIDSFVGQYNDEANRARMKAQFEGTYLKDMADTQYAIDADNRYKKQYEEMVLNDTAMTDWQKQFYESVIGRRNFEDMSDPYVRQRYQLEQDKKNAMNAQDVAMNQGLVNMDAQAFQQAQGLQQQMSDRGIQDSGIAAAMYNQAQMANNQQYQQAYTQGTAAKADMQTQFNNAISNSRLTQAGFEAEQQQAIRENATKLQEIQNDRDKWLTDSTGTVYIGGQQVKVDGKPVTTIDWELMNETKRSNVAKEMLDAQLGLWDYQLGLEKNANDRLGLEYDYSLGLDSNAIKREQNAIDLQIAMSQLQFDYANLDYNYAKLESNNAIAQDKLSVAIDNAQTAADKNKLSALKAQLSDLTKQITTYQKAGKKVPAELDTAYRNVIGQIQSLAGTSGGSPATTKDNWAVGSQYYTP